MKIYLHGWPEKVPFTIPTGFGREPSLQRRSLAGDRALSESAKVLTFQFKMLIA